MLKQPKIDNAEAIALRALAFLASDGERLGRFLALSGMGPAELRASAGEPALLAGVLEHLMGDETLLMVFTAEAGLAPESVGAALVSLGGRTHEDHG